jgi:2-succinyl-6-hydroxy-2,4-cyclohexadiene-1-carboxylate synthase
MTPPERLVFLHGFTQTAAAWETFVGTLQRRCPLLIGESQAIDLPGHGTDPDGRADLWECAERAAASGGSGVYVGYSMGGRVALHAALARADRVKGLVLISTTAGIDDDDERALRRSDDDELAARIEQIGVEAFVDEWLSRPMFAGLGDAASDRSLRLANTATGLADSLRHAGTGTQQPLWSRLAEIRIPVLVIAGARDDKFVDIAHRLVGAVPDATLTVVPDAGHNVVLEKPDPCADAICAWLAARVGSADQDNANAMPSETEAP